MQGELGGYRGGGDAVRLPASAVDRARDCTAVCQAGVPDTWPTASSSLLLDMVCEVPEMPIKKHNEVALQDDSVQQMQ